MGAAGADPGCREVPARDSSVLARLPIDRVFTMKGFGAVVTGTLVSGTIRKEDELEVFPEGQRVRVRGVQIHGLADEQAVAGQRTALNLASVTTQELARGMVLAPHSAFHSSSRIDVSLTLLPSARPLKNRARVIFTPTRLKRLPRFRSMTASRCRREKPPLLSFVWLNLRCSCPETGSSCGSSRRC